MSDRLPGSSFSNPIKHRGWLIFLDDCAGTHPMGYAFVHEDYDPTPLYADDGPSDHRHGWARTLDEAKAEIDEQEDDGAVAGWQSIETAPKGNESQGPFFDVTWVGAEHQYLPVPKRAIDCYREGDLVKVKHGYPSVTTIFHPQPTHWMPSPPRPSVERSAR